MVRAVCPPVLAAPPPNAYQYYAQTRASILVRTIWLTIPSLLQGIAASSGSGPLHESLCAVTQSQSAHNPQTATELHAVASYAVPCMLESSCCSSLSFPSSDSISRGARLAEIATATRRLVATWRDETIACSPAYGQAMGAPCRCNSLASNRSNSKREVGKWQNCQRTAPPTRCGLQGPGGQRLSKAGASLARSASGSDLVTV